MSSISSDSNLHQLEDDRDALRVEITPGRYVTASKAAWLLGRLCNEQRFRFQSAWIECRDSEPARTLEVWVDMRELVAQVQDNSEAVFQLTGAIDAARTSWESGFDSEWHNEEVVEANEMVRRYRFEHSDLPHNLQEVDYLDHISSNAVTILKHLHHRLFQHFAEPLQRAFELGQIADQLIHPNLNSHIFRFECDPSPAIEQRGSSASAAGSLNVPATEQPGSSASDTGSLNFPAPHWNVGTVDSYARTNDAHRYLRLPNQLSGPWPNAEWLREAQHKYASFCQCTNQRVTRAGAHWTSEIPISDRLDFLEACIDAAEPDDRVESNVNASANSLTKRGERSARSLGLTLNSSRMEIQTADTIASRLPPQGFRLLVYFLNRYPDTTSTTTLCENWSLVSPQRKSIISANSVHAAISQLNSALERTGLRIISENGYRISCNNSRPDQ